MTYRHHLVLYHTVTPLHVGCGQDVGVVDLPVIRERTTGYPFLPGSGIRGALRERFESGERGKAEADQRVGLLFGPEADKWEVDEERFAGCVAVHDAKLLLFPVRSDRSLFLWLTCPAVVARYARDVAVFAADGGGSAWQPAARPGDGELVAPAGLAAAGRVYLEEFVYTELEGGDRDGLAAWAADLGRRIGIADLAARTVLVSDGAFAYFCRQATLIQQHNRLSSAKTVQDGALFSLEAVPPEAVFYGFFGATGSRWPGGRGEKKDHDAVLAEVRAGLGFGEAPAGLTCHFGGGESTGLGLTRVVWQEGGEAHGR